MHGRLNFNVPVGISANISLIFSSPNSNNNKQKKARKGKGREWIEGKINGGKFSMRRKEKNSSAPVFRDGRDVTQKNKLADKFHTPERVVSRP